ncbi:hypothetical protein [Salinispora arenicola]|uniref:hypothetical protein n=1 Tax=Salinispora arenicola TaxID=168697 RepID=UPI00207927FE|nr:hypothetical protein [Salinispora arenicola]MCN0154239.1 hypothetical protein [Salinispora arenicola]
MSGGKCLYQVIGVAHLGVIGVAHLGVWAALVVDVGADWWGDDLRRRAGVATVDTAGFR